MARHERRTGGPCGRRVPANQPVSRTDGRHHISTTHPAVLPLRRRRLLIDICVVTVTVRLTLIALFWSTASSSVVRRPLMYTSVRQASHAASKQPLPVAVHRTDRHVVCAAAATSRSDTQLCLPHGLRTFRRRILDISPTTPRTFRRQICVDFVNVLPILMHPLPSIPYPLSFLPFH